MRVKLFEDFNNQKSVQEMLKMIEFILKYNGDSSLTEMIDEYLSMDDNLVDLFNMDYELQINNITNSKEEYDSVSKLYNKLVDDYHIDQFPNMEYIEDILDAYSGDMKLVGIDITNYDKPLLSYSINLSNTKHLNAYKINIEHFNEIAKLLYNIDNILSKKHNMEFLITTSMWVSIQISKK